MKGAIDEEAPIPECIICRMTELEGEKKLITNTLCECFYNYHYECMEQWLKYRTRKCMLCDKRIDFKIISPPSALDNFRLELRHRRRREERRNNFYFFFVLFMGLFILILALGLVLYVIYERKGTL